MLLWNSLSKPWADQNVTRHYQVTVNHHAVSLSNFRIYHQIYYYTLLLLHKGRQRPRVSIEVQRSWYTCFRFCFIAFILQDISDLICRHSPRCFSNCPIHARLMFFFWPSFLYAQTISACLSQSFFFQLTVVLFLTLYKYKSWHFYKKILGSVIIGLCLQD